MDETYALLSSSMVFGLSSGIAPGPLMTLTISETLRHGLAGGLKVALAPVLTDGVLIFGTWVLYSKLSDITGFLGFTALAGSAFLFYLAFESFKVGPPDASWEEGAPSSLRKGVLTNFLNPSPYLFWATVGTPTLLKASQVGVGTAVSFLAIFFVCISGAKACIALAVARYRDRLNDKAYQWIMRVLGLALGVFGLLFLRDGLHYFQII